MEMDNKAMMAELIGSMAITLLVWGNVTDSGAEQHGTAAAAGMAAVVLAIMWMTFKGSEIIPILTIGNMAAGRIDWQTGALNFSMQVLGGLIGAGILYWGMDGDAGFTDVANFGATEMATALIGGFLLMTVWDRLGGSWETAAFAAVLTLAGVILGTASSIGSMIVTSAWSDANFVGIFGTMIVGGIGAAAALMLGDQFLPEEE
jgi:glycerol uptake facilitator-like aquaporin